MSYIVCVYVYIMHYHKCILFDLSIQLTLYIGLTYARNEHSGLHNTETMFLKGMPAYLPQIKKKIILCTNYGNYFFIISHSGPCISGGQKYFLLSLDFAVLSEILNVRQMFNKYWMTERKLSKCSAFFRVFSSLTFGFADSWLVMIKSLIQLHRSSLGATGRGYSAVARSARAIACEVTVMERSSVPLDLIFYLADMYLNGWSVVIFVILILVALRELKECLTDTPYKKQQIISASITCCFTIYLCCGVLFLYQFN